MTDDREAARRQAEDNFLRNPQTPMASETGIRDAIIRNEYNAELDRQRRERDNNR
ncbi:hypothetical protein [Bradyrhizobium sp.]|uniref:hypothetical protein n=1 Tax=Bradyrhizobium sp. TaxID=376 RepID=UPI0039E270AF